MRISTEQRLLKVVFQAELRNQNALEIKDKVLSETAFSWQSV